MNYFLVGNGYDLHHKFPTRYYDFLHVVSYLIDHYEEEISTVGQVFSSIELQEQDTFIKECYEQHMGVFNDVALADRVAKDIADRANKNIWFNYFNNYVKNDFNWIDFEKEVLRVLEAFESFFDYGDNFTLNNNRIMFNLDIFPKDAEDNFIISKFNFFFEKPDADWGVMAKFKYVKREFAVEHIKESNTYYLATDKIVSELYSSLRELTDILRDYLFYFVDNSALKLVELGIVPKFGHLPTPNRVYSFNYTKTIEILYGNYMVDHIHGITDTEIVLGINPDEKDDINTIDTTFLQFKKYFQRVLYKTDIDFTGDILTRSGDIKNLYVIGHSLDATDKDIIKLIFDASKEIFILYHDDSSVKRMIRNLVEMYGKEAFDELRCEKNLQFFKQPDIIWNVRT